MKLEEAKKLVKKHTDAVIAHYQAVNESSRKNPAACAKRESNMVRAFTGQSLEVLERYAGHIGLEAKRLAFERANKICRL